MTQNVKAVPEGFHTLTPSFAVRDAKRAIEFYKRAFGAVELTKPHEGPGGKIIHANLRIGDSNLMLADEFPEYGSHSPQSLNGTPVTIHIYTENPDAMFEQAVSAGAKVTMPMGDQFWGDRYGQIQDPFGHKWSIAARKENLTEEEMTRRGQAAMAKMAKKAKGA
ncbi:MAG: VOC family protein [Candidatus Acidiferrales bacterium]